MTTSGTEKKKADKKPHPLWLIIQDVTKITIWTFSILWHVHLLLIVLDIKINLNAVVSTLFFVIASMFFLITVFAGIGIWEYRKAENPSGDTILQKYAAFKLAILSVWGMIFRTLFISCIGIAAYFWFDPQPLGDIPFSQLTLNKIFSSLFGVVIPLGCILWFFKFPDNKNHACTHDPKQNSYVIWGTFGVVLISLVIVVVAYGGMLLKNL